MTVTDRPTTDATQRRDARGPRLAVAPIAYLRVLGFLTVLLFHAYQNSGYNGFAGWPGAEVWERLLVGGAAGSVDAFFVITAFLVSRAVVRGALADGPVASGRTLLVRKATALLPAYYVAVFLVWAISNPVLTGNWEDLLLHLTFTQVFSDTYIFWTLGPAWFIAVAVQYYVLIAVGAGPLQRYCLRSPDPVKRVRVLLGVVAGLLVVCWVYKLGARFLVDVPDTSWSAWYGPMSRLDLLGMGIGLALVSVLRPRVSVAGAWLLRVAAAAVAVVAVLNYPNQATAGSNAGFWQDSVLGLAVLLFLLPSVSTPRATSTPVGAAPPSGLLSRVVAVATPSYGVYIWQEPILRVLNGADVLPPDSSPWAFPVTVLVLLLLSLAAAKIGYHLIEEPGRSFAAWSQRRTGPPRAPLGRSRPSVQPDHTDHADDKRVPVLVADRRPDRLPDPLPDPPLDAEPPAADSRESSSERAYAGERPVDVRDEPTRGVPGEFDHAGAVSAAAITTSSLSAPVDTGTVPPDRPAPADPPARPVVRPARPLLGFLVAATPVVLLGVLAVFGADQRVTGSGEAATAAGAVLGPYSPLAGLSWPNVFPAHQIAALEVLLAPVGPQGVIDAARTVLLVVNVAVCLLLWPAARRIGLSPVPAALAVAVGGLPVPLVAVLYGSVDAGALAALWLAVAAVVSGRGRGGRVAAIAASAAAVLTAPLAAVGLLAFAAYALLTGALTDRRPTRATQVWAALLAGTALWVAVLSTGSGPWVVSGGGRCRRCCWWV